MKKAVGILILVLGLAWLLPAPAIGFVLLASESQSTGKYYPIRWSRATQKVRFVVNDQPLELLSNIANGSTPLAAAEEALRTWALAPPGLYLDGTDPRTDGVKDGVNLITFANTPKNRDVVGNSRAVCLTWSGSRQSSQLYWPITETDVVISPTIKWTTNGEANLNDAQSTLTHELGHALGLDHSPIAGVTMFAFGVEGQTHRRRLNADDLAGIRAVYGIRSPDRGSIGGRVVNTDGTPVFGAHVVAVDEDGIIPTSAVTNREGNFLLRSLPPGGYGVYVEPLDGPMTPKNINEYYHKAQQDFRTAIARAPEGQGIRVVEGATTFLDPITVERQPPGLNPNFIGWSSDGRSWRNLPPAALIEPGGRSYLVVGGAGLDLASAIDVTGRDITLDRRSVRRAKSTDGLPFIILPLAVNPGARPGARSLLLETNDEIAAYTGGIMVVGP